MHRFAWLRELADRDPEAWGWVWRRVAARVAWAQGARDEPFEDGRRTGPDVLRRDLEDEARLLDLREPIS